MICTYNIGGEWGKEKSKIWSHPKTKFTIIFIPGSMSSIIEGIFFCPFQKCFFAILECVVDGTSQKLWEGVASETSLASFVKWLPPGPSGNGRKSRATEQCSGICCGRLSWWNSGSEHPRLGERTVIFVLTQRHRKFLRHLTIQATEPWLLSSVEQPPASALISTCPPQGTLALVGPAPDT